MRFRTSGQGCGSSVRECIACVDSSEIASKPERASANFAYPFTCEASPRSKRGTPQLRFLFVPFIGVMLAIGVVGEGRKQSRAAGWSALGVVNFILSLMLLAMAKVLGSIARMREAPKQ